MSAVANSYFQRYAIGHIGLQMQSGVVDSADPVCNLILKFEAGYQVQFKLLGGQALLGEQVSEISPGGVVNTIKGSTPEDLENKLSEFFSHIESRLDRIEHDNHRGDRFQDRYRRPADRQIEWHSNGQH